jgi:hypothetical protein
MSYSPYAAPQPGPAPTYAPQPSSADSVGSWMATILVSAIPLVGFVYVLVVAFGGSSSESKKNWARATVIWMLIGLAVSVILGVWAATTGATYFNEVFSGGSY